MVFFVRITVNQSHLRPICKSTKFNPKIQRTIYLINFQQLRLHVPDFIRTVVKKVSNMTKKGKHTVLFICLGNICRSPAAEGIMKSLVEKAGLQDEFEIDSAGIGSWHIGQLPDSRMRKCGAEHGYNFNSHARQFQKSDFARFETIVVMDNENYRAITSMASSESDRKKVVRMADFLTHHREYTTVPDPYYGDYSDFELVITLLEDACQELLDSIIGEG